MALWLVAALTAGLVLLHMIRPRFERRIISAARFFEGLPPARKGMPRLRLSSPVGSRPLYLQLPLMLLALAAVWSARSAFSDEEVLGFGVWIVVDSSSSMITADGTGARMDNAVREVRKVISEARRQAGGRPVCFRLSTFDLALAHLAETTDDAVIEGMLGAVKPRALGTDLNLVRGLRASLANQAGDCMITHLVVISDIPAPDWTAEDAPVRTVWRHVGRPTSNVGFTGIKGVRDPLTGRVRSVEVTVTAYGSTGFTRLRIADPDGNAVLEESPAWNPDGRFTASFQPTRAGRYVLQLDSEDAYAPDNRAEIDIGGGSDIRVDWRPADRTLPDALGWRQDTDQPHLRVASLPIIDDQVPTLYLGNGYRGGTAESISDFYESSQLVADLNLDVAETLTMNAPTLPEGFKAVLRRTDGTVPAAERQNPPAVLVPGVPLDTDDNIGRFSSTLFFNGVRWLLGERPLPPLYTLTTPEQPEAEGIRLALHPDEGNTARRGRQFGDLTAIQPVPVKGESVPFWPMLLAAAALFFALERILGAYAGPQWR